MPENKQNIAVIGDIHGCINTLEKLYSRLPSDVQVYSVGDLVDRGRFSREVVSFVEQNGIRPVRGNHEDMLIKAVDACDRMFSFAGKELEHHYTNGGRETQYSYILSRATRDFKKFATEFRACGHYDFMKTFPVKIEFEKAVITHAGIINESDEMSMMWNRREPLFINKLQIHGHTPLTEFSYKPNHFANIDTACVYRNKLTAIIVETLTGKVVEVIQENCNTEDVY